MQYAYTCINIAVIRGSIIVNRKRISKRQFDDEATTAGGRRSAHGKRRFAGQSERGVTDACPVPMATGVALGNHASASSKTMLPTTAERHHPVSTAAGHACAWLLPLPAWRGQWSALQSLVPDAARRRCAGIRDDAKRRDRLLAAALHRRVLARALGMAEDRVPLYRSPGGQPRLALPGLHTSLAHADGMVAVALSASGPVGVDVEMRSVASLRPIADLVCAPAEADALRDRGREADADLLALWVRKEALLKAAGIGLAHAMDGFCAPEGGRVVLRDAGGDRLELAAHMYTQSPDCIAALAAPVGVRPHWNFLTP